MTTAKITAVIDGHGKYECSGDALERAIEAHLPASIAAVRSYVEDRSGIDWSDVTDMGTLLVVIGDWIDAEQLNAPASTRFPDRSTLTFGDGRSDDPYAWQLAAPDRTTVVLYANDKLDAMGLANTMLRNRNGAWHDRADSTPNAPAFIWIEN